jgi:hypothetical protein
MKNLDADSPKGILLGWLEYTCAVAAEFARADQYDGLALEQHLEWAAANLAQALSNVTDEGKRSALR